MERPTTALNNEDSDAVEDPSSYFEDEHLPEELKKWHNSYKLTGDTFEDTYKRAISSRNPEVVKSADRYRDAFYLLQGKKKRLKQDFKSATEASFQADSYANVQNQHQIGARSQINYKTLRRLALYPMIQAIIRTRKSQVSPYLKPSANVYEPGFQVKKKQRYYARNRKPMLSETLTEFLMNCGDEEYYTHSRDRFLDFITKLLDDSLVFDQAVYEVQFSQRTGRPCCFVHVPAETIEVIPEDRRMQYKQKGHKEFPKYVQIINGHPRAFFYEWEMGFGVRNHDTSFNSLGYGYSEVQNLSEHIRNLGRFEEFNMANFTNGAIPKGVLLIKGDGPSGEVFNESMSQKLGGQWNNGRVPVIHTNDEVEYLTLQQKMNDLEYGNYFKLILNIVCATYKISPEEIGFRTESGYQAAQSVRGQQSEKEHSISKGLLPLLDHIAQWVNEKIIYPKTDGEYEFSFTGIDKEIVFNTVDTIAKLSQTAFTVNEARKFLSPYFGELPPLPEGDIIANSLTEQERANIMTQLSGSNPYAPEEGMEGVDSQKGQAPAEGATNTSSSKSKNNMKNSGKEANDRSKQVESKKGQRTMGK